MFLKCFSFCSIECFPTSDDKFSPPPIASRKRKVDVLCVFVSLSFDLHFMFVKAPVMILIQSRNRLCERAHLTPTLNGKLPFTLVNFQHLIFPLSLYDLIPVKNLIS